MSTYPAFKKSPPLKNQTQTNQLIFTCVSGVNKAWDVNMVA